MPSQRTHFLELEQRWSLAAESLRPKIVEETKAPMANSRGADVPRGRPTKFTPERIEQIGDLVAGGKSRDEIAGLLGVTVNSLQVTCSKLGISLRRRLKLNLESNLPRHEILLRGRQQNDTAAPRPEDIDGQQMDAANLALTMHLQGLERTIPLPLSNEVIIALVLEAQLRKTSLGQLVGEIVASAVATGLSDLLDGELVDAA
jgi:hypothetical protein